MVDSLDFLAFACRSETLKILITTKIIIVSTILATHGKLSTFSY